MDCEPTQQTMTTALWITSGRFLKHYTRWVSNKFPWKIPESIPGSPNKMAKRLENHDVGADPDPPGFQVSGPQSPVFNLPLSPHQPSDISHALDQPPRQWKNTGYTHDGRKIPLISKPKLCSMPEESTLDILRREDTNKYCSAGHDANRVTRANSGGIPRSSPTGKCHQISGKGIGR